MPSQRLDVHLITAKKRTTAIFLPQSVEMIPIAQTRRSPIVSPGSVHDLPLVKKTQIAAEKKHVA